MGVVLLQVRLVGVWIRVAGPIGAGGCVLGLDVVLLVVLGVIVVRHRTVSLRLLTYLPHITGKHEQVDR
jgi:hypothetical protein